MFRKTNLSLYYDSNQGGDSMPRSKTALLSLIVICLTILCFTWMMKDSLCEVYIKDGNSEISATNAYESK